MKAKNVLFSPTRSTSWATPSADVNSSFVTFLPEDSKLGKVKSTSFLLLKLCKSLWGFALNSLFLQTVYSNEHSFPTLRSVRGFFKAIQPLLSLLGGLGGRHNSGVTVMGMCCRQSTNPKSNSELCSAKGNSCLTPKVNCYFLIIYEGRIAIFMLHKAHQASIWFIFQEEVIHMLVRYTLKRWPQRLFPLYLSHCYCCVKGTPCDNKTLQVGLVIPPQSVLETSLETDILN